MKQYVSAIMLCVFFWANTTLAKQHPAPNVEPENQAASEDIFQLKAEPVLSWTKDNILVICKANCGSSNSDRVYALYQSGGFPAKTSSQIVPTPTGQLSYTIQYRLDGNTSWQTITKKMLVNKPPIIGPTSGQPNIPATTPDGRPIMQMQIKYVIEETGTVYLENETSYAYIWGVIKNKNGEMIMGHNIYVVDKITGKTMLSTMNVDIKITHWAELAKTLGIVAGITTTVGLLVFWAPGVIIAATPGLF